MLCWLYDRNLAVDGDMSELELDFKEHQTFTFGAESSSHSSAKPAVITRSMSRK